MRTRSKIVLAALSAAVLGVAGATTAFAAGDGRNGGGAAAPRALKPAVVTASSTEAVFVPITPCRIVDTRLGGGKIASGATRSFVVRGTVLFVPQGGKAGGCGVPASATGVATNVTVVNAGGTGYMAGFPAGAPAPLTNFVTYWSDRVVTVNPTFALSAPGTSPHLSIKSVGSSANVIIDVTGYYAPQMAGFVQADGTLTYTSGRVLSSSHPSTGNYDVTFDRDVSQCAFHVSVYDFNWVAAVGPMGSNGAHVYIHDQVSPYTQHDTSFFITAVC